MPHRRTVMAGLVCLLCAAACVSFWSSAAATDKPAEKSNSARSAEQTMRQRVETSKLKKSINFYRQATWRTQDTLQKPHTRSSYSDRRIDGPAYLKWESRLWRHRWLAIKHYAQHILASRGYLPPTQARILGRYMAAKQGWIGRQWQCLDWLWGTKGGKRLESGWYARADNPSSHAHGIPQAYPGSKMGPSWYESAYAQIRWGLGYIRDKFHTPCQALSVRLSQGSY